MYINNVQIYVMNNTAGEVREILLYLIDFIGYFSYFFVTPDEFFKKRVMQTSTIVLILVSILMLGFYLGFIITQNVNFFSNGFWITFTVLLILFPLIFTIFEIKDSVKPE